MKTAIICISDVYLYRGLQLKDYYESRGDEVLVITPDFSHRNKRRLRSLDPRVVLIDHPSYQRNLSIRRLYGHWRFAWLAEQKLEEWEPERIHCLLPANTLAAAMDQYKQNHPDVRLYFDINDLWPESLPMGTAWWMFPLIWWRRLRDAHLQAADLVFVECGLYTDTLTKYNQLDFQQLYWASEEPLLESRPRWQEEVVHLAYLGSINNIIDIDQIAALIAAIQKYKPVVLHIVGSGESKDRLLEQASQAGAQIEDHGEIFDPASKQNIFDGCRFGLNVMKPSVVVGLSMKSLDYLAAGLPLLNTLEGDSAQMCQKEGCGIHLDRNHLDQTARLVALQSKADNYAMRKQARTLFDSRFTAASLHAGLDTAIARQEQARQRKNDPSDTRKALPAGGSAAEMRVDGNLQPDSLNKTIQENRYNEMDPSILDPRVQSVCEHTSGLRNASSSHPENRPDGHSEGSVDLHDEEVL